ncbi:MAG: hypothetical protein K0R57_2653 [Paenibacillaceae bacterium]|jgi:hypothetical protein|nr:hypothetical protein [Paenibacillaceae bacterium]
MPQLMTFSERSFYLLRFIAGSPLPPEWDWRRRLLHQAIARLGLSVRTEEAVSHISRVMETPGDNDLMFLRHPLADIMHRFRTLIPATLCEHIRLFLCNPEEYKLQGGTENHKLMNAVSGYLTARLWRDWEHSAAVLEHCRLYLDGYFARVVRYGQGEFDSSTYSVLYLNTLATLHDFAGEPLMKRKAGMMLEWYLLNTAGEWLNGHFAGAQSRDYGSTYGPEHPGGGQIAAWLYLGGSVPGLNGGEPHYSAINALSSYRFPEELCRLAADRSEPFLHLESHDLTEAAAPTHDGNETRPAGSPSGLLQGYGYISRTGVRKTTYMHRHYALGSMMDGQEGDIIWSGQMRRWSLKWDSPNPHSVMFVTHPFPDFSPERDPYRAKWQGSSPYEQVLQHNRTLLAVYRIPRGKTYKFGPREPFPSDRDPYLEGFISGTAVLHKIERSGWVFAHGGTVLFGLYFVKPYEWVYDVPRTPDHMIHGRIRSCGLHNGLVVETAAAQSPIDDADAQRAELEAYAGKIIAAARIETAGMTEENGQSPFLAYCTLEGDRLSIQYDGERMINGNLLHESEWPLIGSPFLHSEVGSGTLAVDLGGWKRRYDYLNWTVE